MTDGTQGPNRPAEAAARKAAAPAEAAAHDEAAALAEAAASAGYAPSVHNTQPWRWRVLPDRLELRAERARQLRATDPDGRLLGISCGAALHHARLALAAHGLTVRVDRLPDPAEPELLAVLAVTGRCPVTAQAVRLAQATRLRHTDRRPVSDVPADDEALAAIRAAVDDEDLDLHVLSTDQLADLAAVAGRAAEIEAEDPAIVEELAYWTGRSPEGTGVPPEVLPADTPRTTIPARDFGVRGTLPIGPGHDRAARYAVLFGPDDEPLSWLRAGEALSAAWLTATGLGVSVLPLSGVVEVPLTRSALRRLLAGLGQPYLVLRLGTADAEHAGPPHPPRLPVAQVVDTSAVRPPHD